MISMIWIGLLLIENSTKDTSCQVTRSLVQTEDAGGMLNGIWPNVNEVMKY